MKALILAAGEGRRMRPLTDNCPKPLLEVNHKSLIEHHLDRLVQAGVTQVVINLAYLGEQIRRRIGNRWETLQIVYSEEPEPLETGGAIHHALPLLGENPFLLVNGDIWTDYNFAELLGRRLEKDLGRLVLVNNPEHHAGGDFRLIASGRLAWAESSRAAEKTYTYAGLGLVSPKLVAEYPDRRAKFPLREAFSWAMEKQRLGAEIHHGQWCDVGTPERLEDIRQSLKGE